MNTILVAETSNSIPIIQGSQSKILRIIINAPKYTPAYLLYWDLNMSQAEVLGANTDDGTTRKLRTKYKKIYRRENFVIINIIDTMARLFSLVLSIVNLNEVLNNFISLKLSSQRAADADSYRIFKCLKKKKLFFQQFFTRTKNFWYRYFYLFVWTASNNETTSWMDFVSVWVQFWMGQNLPTYLWICSCRCEMSYSSDF